MPLTTPTVPAPNLEQLLRRGDIWRGHSGHFSEQPTWDTGHPTLNQALLNQGWPVRQLTEVCQAHRQHCEWLLLAPAVRAASQKAQTIVLVNPPARPFAPGLAAQGIDIGQLWWLSAGNKTDFVTSMVTLLKTAYPAIVVGWEPHPMLRYSELRKVQLAAAESAGLCLLFRGAYAQQQNSPASLRLYTQLNSEHLQVIVSKQRGKLHSRQAFIELPVQWRALPARHALAAEPKQRTPILGWHPRS